jgi:hypothetical protein
MLHRNLARHRHLPQRRGAGRRTATLTAWRLQPYIAGLAQFQL